VRERRGGEKVKKVSVAVSVLALLMTFAVVSPTFAVVYSPSPVIAPGTYVDHENAFGETVIAIDGHPTFVIDGYHFDSGFFGSGDVIRILRYFVLPIGPTYLPVAIFTDIPQRVGLLKILWAGYPTSIQLVEPSAIEAVREGKSKNIHVVWKTALEIPDEYWGPPGMPKVLVPAMTIPPGRLIFRGHGDAFPASSSQTTSTFTQTVTWTVYYGNATFVCPTWDFGGPVGVNAGQYRTNIRPDATVTTTILPPMGYS